MRARFALVALTLAAPSAFGSAEVPPPVFGTRAEIVTVDVVVLDAGGRPVRGLRREDFVVKEDGKAQAVTAFEAIEVPAAGVVEGETRRASATRVSTNVAAPATRRTFAVVFDDLHVGSLRTEQAKAAVAAFVAREVRPGDRLLLFTTSDARYWSTTRGADDAAWLEALARVRSRQKLPSRPACRITEYEAMRIEDFGDGTVCDMVSRRRQALGCMEDVLDCSRVGASAAETAASVRGPTQRLPSNPMAAAESHAVGRAARLGSLRTVREMLRAVAPVAGRKEVVFVSEGFPLDPSMDVFREVRQEAARANAAIHFLDPRGLTTGPEFLSAAATTGLPEGRDLAMTLALWPLEDGGTKALAEETGGRVLQTNDLVAGLVRVADESRAYYLLGYAPADGKRDGRYRKLHVEVTRRGLEVRARAGYFASGRREKRDRREKEPTSAVSRAMADLFDEGGVPLRLAVYVMGPAALDSPVPKTGVEVLVAGEVRLDALETRVRNGRTVAEPELTLLTGARGGEWHRSEWTLTLDLTPRTPPGPPAAAAPAAAPAAAAAPASRPAPADAAWHPFLTRIAVEPGEHRARLVVENGTRVGSVTRDFVVPPFTEERLSTPILSDRLLVGGGPRGLMPLVRREFSRDVTLHCWVELHGASRDDVTGLAGAAASFVARSSDGRQWASGPPVEMKTDAGRLVRLVSLPLTDAPLGESEIVLTVRDDVSRSAFEAREPFRVLPGDAPAAVPAPGGAPGALLPGADRP
jgi:VWFA-related protein